MFLFKRLAAIIVIVVLLATCGGKEERKEKYLERGKAYLEEGNLDKARIEFKNVVQIDPKSAQAFMYLGQVEEEEKAWGKAFGNYTRAIDLDPTLVEPRVLIAKVYLTQAGSYKSQDIKESEANMRGLAKEQMDAILEMEPENPEGLSLQASVWVDEGETEKATSQLQEILKSNPGMKSAAILLSAIHAKAGKVDEAEKILLTALSNTDEHASIRSRLVQFYLIAKKNDQAEGMLREMVQVEPDKLQYRVLLANFLAKNEKIDGAEQVLRDAIAADPVDASRYLLLSDFQSNKRSLETAISELEATIKAHPDLSDLQFGLINLYQKDNQLDKIREELNQIIAVQGLEPAGMRARVAMAQLLASEDQEQDKVNRLLIEVLTKNPRDSAALMLRGRLAGKDKRWVDAINDFRSVLKNEPDSVEALKLLAAAHLANNETILAKDTLKKALDISSSDTALRFKLASILSAEKNHDQALAQIDLILEVEPENQQALNSKFNLLALKGDAEGMTIVARTLQTTSPDSEDGFIREARLLFAQKDFEKSMSMANDIMVKNPSSIPGLLLQSDIYTAKKNYDGALKIVRQLKKLQPDNARGYYREAKLLTAQKNVTGAIAAYQEGLSKAPSSVEILSNLSVLQIQEGKTTEAIKHLRDVLSENAEHPEANELLGIAHMKNEEYAKAEEAFSRQIAINPNNVVVYLQLASSRIAQDNKKGAVKAYEDGIAAVPDNPRLMLALAGLMEEQKDYIAAIALYEQLLDKQPENAIGINNLSVLISDHAEDASSMSKAVEYAKMLEKEKQPIFRDTAAWVYYKSGDIKKALELATLVIEEMPNVAVFNYHLGMIYMKKGDSSNARKFLSKAVSGEDFNGIESARSALEKL